MENSREPQTGKSLAFKNGSDIARVLQAFYQSHLGHYVSGVIHQEGLDLISRKAGRRLVDTAELLTAGSQSTRIH